MKADGKVITLFSRKAIQQDAVIEKVEELRRKNLVVVVPEKKISCEKELVEYEILQDIRKTHSYRLIVILQKGKFRF